ncbi:hypothetical protein FRC07_008043 [Ceratobasidium sp. 392]|nr:hypothetical protein FRC07_008043 [Ceratobasidium sp. 392]
MVQIPTRARTLSFSVRGPGQNSSFGRTRPLDPLARGEEPDAKRARQSYAPISIRAPRIPLAPQSVNVTVTAVPFPTNDDPAATEDAECDSAWGTSSLPSPTPTAPTTSPRQKRLIARTSSAPTPPPASTRPAPPPPAPSPPPPSTTWIRRPSPLAPYWKPTSSGACVLPTRTRRGRVPPEPLVRRALRAHFSRTPHGAAVIKLGARRAIAQAECVAAVERVRQAVGSSEIVNARRGAVANMEAVAPPVLMVSPPSPTSVSVPLAPMVSDDEWVPLSVQPMEVEPDERDMVEMETDGWCRV